MIYFVPVLYVGLIISYTFFLKTKDHKIEKITNFFNLNFQKNDAKSSKNLFVDTTILYKELSQSLNQACPDSTWFKVFFKKGQSKVAGLMSFFKFITNSFKTFEASFQSIDQTENIISSRFLISTSKKYYLTISFLEKENKLKIYKIEGMQDFAAYLCNIIKQKV